jgi:hypothetical protein
MATTGGYIITIVGLDAAKQIQFGSSTSETASTVYHLTIDNGSNESSTEKVDISDLQAELEKLSTTSTSLLEPNKLPILTGVLAYNTFQVKYAEKDGVNIKVTDAKPTTKIGGKKRSQHKYSRKR